MRRVLCSLSGVAIAACSSDPLRPPEVPVTPVPSAETLRLMRQAVAPELAEVYPQFAARVFGFKASA